MQRFLLISTVWVVFVVGIAHAAPARPIYEPQQSAPPPVPLGLNLTGTAWLGKYMTINRTFILEADGTVSYKTTTKTVFRNRGTWRLEGNTLIFEHWINPKSKLIEFRGTLTDPNTISGHQIVLRTGARIATTMQRTVLPPR